MSAARVRVMQPAPALEHAASGQSGTSVIRGRRSSSTPRMASSSSSHSCVARSSRPLVDAIPRLVSSFPAQIVGEGHEPAPPGGRSRAPSRRATRASPARRRGGGRRPCAHGRLGVEPLREPFRRVGATRVAPAEDRRERVPALVDGDEAVREARGRVRLLVPEHAPDGCRDLGWIVGLVLLLPQLAGRLAALVELLGAHRGGADVECEHAHSLQERESLRRARSARGRRSVRSARAAPCRAGARS